MHEIVELVEHPAMPDWGPGKVLEVSGSKVKVYFRDVPVRAIRTIDTDLVSLKPASIESDTFLDNLPPLTADQTAKVNKRVTFEDGLEKFRHHFPKGFDDPTWTEGDSERGYKWKAHELFHQRLGEGKGGELASAGNVDELREKLLQVENSLNLLSPYEKMALRDALAVEEAAMSFFKALFSVVEADDRDERAYRELISAVNALPHEEGKARVATWPILTQFPFIARPDCHMFLKPEVTKSCADRMLFDLNYKPEPNWGTYKQLMVLSDALFERLKPSGARDYIDVQSFIWVIGAYD